MTELTPEQIAKGLTEAECHALKRAAKHSASDNILLPVFRDGGRITRSLIEKGLAEWVGLGARLTPTGLRVRAILEAQDAKEQSNG